MPRSSWKDWRSFVMTWPPWMTILTKSLTSTAVMLDTLQSTRQLCRSSTLACVMLRKRWVRYCHPKTICLRDIVNFWDDNMSEKLDTLTLISLLLVKILRVTWPFQPNFNMTWFVLMIEYLSLYDACGIILFSDWLILPGDHRIGNTRQPSHCRDNTGWC